MTLQEEIAKLIDFGFEQDADPTAIAQAAIDVVERRVLSDEYLDMLEQHGLIPAWQAVKESEAAMGEST